MQVDSCITGKEFNNLRRPCIYLWFRQERCLYVGCSMYGIIRLLRKHHVIDVVEPVQDDDVIQFIWFDSVTKKQLWQQERHFIDTFTPFYNDQTAERRQEIFLDLIMKHLTESKKISTYRYLKHSKVRRY